MATKTKAENATLSTILCRLDRIEDRLFGNGESLLERVARLETGQQLSLQRLEEYHAQRKVDIEEAALKAHEKTNELLLTQVNEQKRQNKMQFLGLWLTIVGLVVGMFASQALGWFR